MTGDPNDAVLQRWVEYWQQRTVNFRRARASRTKKQIARIDYEKPDQPLVDEMREGILSGRFKNKTDAARAFARRAEGATEASRVKRLARRYKERFRDG